MSVLFLVGLTGSGKSTVLPVVLAAGTRILLPDRRALTDEVIIPRALQLDGAQPVTVSDRVERFRLGARYRQEHPDGIVHALHRYLEAGQPAESAVFDGLRGRTEVIAADRIFSGARFLLLAALEETRIERLASRRDPFDRVGGKEAFTPGETEGDGQLLERQAALARANRIVEEEQRHYDQDGARRYLESLPGEKRLIVDTDGLSAAQVSRLVERWL